MLRAFRIILSSAVWLGCHLHLNDVKRADRSIASRTLVGGSDTRHNRIERDSMLRSPYRWLERRKTKYETRARWIGLDGVSLA